MDTEGRLCEDTGRMSCEFEDGHLQAKESGLEQTLLYHLSEGTNPDNILTLDF